MTEHADWAVRVPASSANLGSGFDVLGMALNLHAEVGCGMPPEPGLDVDEHHPAAVAFVRAGGTGPIWVRSPIPMGRGMGFSGAMRIGGAAAAVVQRSGHDQLDDAERTEVLAVASELEGHADNAAASLHGGVVVVADGVVTRVPMAFDPAVVVWVPDGITTSTERSRTVLSDRVSRADAVFNLGRVATLVAAFGSADTGALRFGADDRLHQSVRLAALPATAAALQAGLDADVFAAWLSGSGPSVAMLCESSRAADVAAALPTNGHAKQLRIDHEGVAVTAAAGSD